jgi:hypothetical protein
MSLVDGLSMEGDGHTLMGVVVAEAAVAGVDTAGVVPPIALRKAGSSARGGALPPSAPPAAETAGTSSMSSVIEAK